MPNVTASHVAEIQIWSSFGEQAAVTTRHLLSRVGNVSIPIATILAEFDSIIAAPWKAILTEEARYDGLRGRVLTPTETQWEAEINSAGVGTVIGEPLPRQVSGIVTMNTAVFGRKGRGRLYLPFPSEEDSEPTLGIPGSAYVTAAQSIGDFFTQPLVVTIAAVNYSLDWVLQSVTDGVPSYFLYTGAVARPRWATQRRRGSYGRPNASPLQ